MQKIVLLLAILLLMPLAMADISISPPISIYNFGDVLNVTIGVTSTTGSNGFVSIKIACSQQELELYKSPLQMKPGEQRSISLVTKLEKSLLNGLQGECLLKASYAGQESMTKQFLVSSDADVTIALIGNSIPGSIVQLSGSALKKNGLPLEGSAELKIPGLSLISTSTAFKGAFAFNISIPETAKSGSYLIQLTAREYDSSNNVANSGIGESSFIVSQILKKLEIALEQVDILPGSEIVYTVKGYDQAGDEMNGEVSLSLNNPQANKVFTQNIQTDMIQRLRTYINTTPGSWQITAKRGDIEGRRSFLIEEYENASLSLAGNTLTVANTGNVPYVKKLNVKIVDKIQVLEVNVPVNENRRYKLKGPVGEHIITVDDDNMTLINAGASLTGGAISFSDANANDVFASVPSWLLYAIALVLLAIAVFLYLKLAKPDYIGKASNAGAEEIKQAVTFEQGRKEKAAVLSVKFKNYKEIREQDLFKTTLERILAKIRATGAQVKQSDDSLIAFLQLQADRRAELESIRLGQALQVLLEEHNRKYKQKIKYGIGIHLGEIIVEQSMAGKYQALGNTIAMVKKLADSTNEAILISDALHDATRGRVKVARDRFGWNVSSISESNQHADFVERFKKRNPVS